MKSILIGMDGGATKISAYMVKKQDNEFFHLGPYSTEKVYSNIPGFINDFSIINLQKQLDDFQKGEFNLSETEIQQGAVLIETCAQAIESIADQAKCKNIIVGIGMPGLKTKNGKGIAVIANGPRMPHYISDLEERLAMGKIKFIRPIKRLGSDADYCGIGENYAEKGLFQGTSNAYYIGLGTGAADALKLKGKLLPFDKTKKWLAKTWEMKNSEDISLESIVSAKGIQNLYAKFSAKSMDELNENKIYADKIVSFANEGDNAAKKTCQIFTETLSDLLLERISTLYSGWADIFEFINPNRQTLSKEHSFCNMLFDRIIIGQRIGIIMQSELGKKQLTIPLIKQLSEQIAISSSLDNSAKSHYAELEKIIQFSNLREAPTLGAAIDAALQGEDNA